MADPGMKPADVASASMSATESAQASMSPVSYDLDESQPGVPVMRPV